MGLYEDDPEEYRRRLEAKLDPLYVRFAMGFAALFQMVHEQIKFLVVDKVKGFYGYDSAITNDWLFEGAQDDWKKGVTEKYGTKAFRASLLWLQDADAITAEECDRLDDIYEHRHSLTHELMAYIVDPEKNPDPHLLNEALSILKKISLFWSQMEIDIQRGINPDLEGARAEDLIPGYMSVIQMAFDALVEGMEEAVGEKNET